MDRVAKTVAKGTTLTAMIAGFDLIELREGYAVAGRFVSYLVKQYEPDKVAHFFRACHGGRDTAIAFTALLERAAYRPRLSPTGDRVSCRDRPYT